jgi:hypothetical protein
MGTILLHFGEAEAKVWLQMALNDYQAQSGGLASIRAALTMWKLGDVEGWHVECRRVCEQESERLSSDDGSREFAAACSRVSPARFLMGDYEQAGFISDRVLDLADELSRKAGYRFGVETPLAIRRMVSGIAAHDRAMFWDGLDVLADKFDTWPSPQSTWEHDLFRFALSLPIASTEAFIRWKMEGDADGIH